LAARLIGLARFDAEGLGVTVLGLALAGFGAAFGAFVLFSDRPFGWNTNAESFIERPNTIFWIAFICGQAALWAVLTVPVVQALRELKSQPRKRGAFVAGTMLTVVVFAFVAIASKISKADYPLPHHTTKITFLTAIGYGVTLLAAIAIWRIHTAVGEEPREGDPTAEQLAKLLRLRQLLNRLLGVQGAVIGAALLSTGALRNAIVDWNKYVADAHDPKLQTVPDFPYVYVLVYGAFFSALLALIYAPTLSRLQLLGRSVRDRAAELPAPTAPSFSSRLQRRKDLEDLLELNLSGSGSFRASVAILTPLVTSVVGLLLSSR
jgi:hypothetical protein